MSVAPHAEPRAAAATAAVARRRGRLRHVGTALIVVGALAIAYAGAVVFWRDPVTDVYARYQQNRLDGQLEQAFDEYRRANPGVGGPPAATTAPPPATSAPAPPPPPRAGLRSIADRYAAGVELGDPLGRISLPAIGVSVNFVHGTRWGADLSRGPGHYPQSTLPGQRGVVAIAGHRTTFGAPFRRIDSLAAGDVVTLQLAYGTFRYRVTGHRIVDNGDWSILRPRPWEKLVLSACHPLYSAEQRWIVFGRLVSATAPDGARYILPKAG